MAVLLEKRLNVLRKSTTALEAADLRSQRPAKTTGATTIRGVNRSHGRTTWQVGISAKAGYSFDQRRQEVNNLAH
jgi:hypothetical protein